MNTDKVIKNIEVIGYGGEGNVYAKYLKRAILEEIESQTYQVLLQGCEKAKETGNTIESSLHELVRRMCETGKSIMELSNGLDELLSSIPQESTMDQLKKQIKYSKNPLEIKMLNKKLNQMYKDMKKR